MDAATNKPITVKNLIVIKMTGEVNAIGDGEAMLYKDGNVQTVKWQQKDLSTRIELIDEQGNEVALNRGDSWSRSFPAAALLLINTSTYSSWGRRSTCSSSSTPRCPCCVHDPDRTCLSGRLQE